MMRTFANNAHWVLAVLSVVLVASGIVINVKVGDGLIAAGIGFGILTVARVVGEVA